MKANERLSVDPEQREQISDYMLTSSSLAGIDRLRPVITPIVAPPPPPRSPEGKASTTGIDTHPSNTLAVHSPLAVGVERTLHR